jgi:hypothetical protein
MVQILKLTEWINATSLNFDNVSRLPEHSRRKYIYMFHFLSIWESVRLNHRVRGSELYELFGRLSVLILTRTSSNLTFLFFRSSSKNNGVLSQIRA